MYSNTNNKILFICFQDILVTFIRTINSNIKMSSDVCDLNFEIPALQPAQAL